MADRMRGRGARGPVQAWNIGVTSGGWVGAFMTTRTLRAARCRAVAGPLPSTAAPPQRPARTLASRRNHVPGGPMTEHAVPTAEPAGLADLKAAHRSAWASGSYASVAERLVDDVPPAAGDRARRHRARHGGARSRRGHRQRRDPRRGPGRARDRARPHPRALRARARARGRRGRRGHLGRGRRRGPAVRGRELRPRPVHARHPVRAATRRRGRRGGPRHPSRRRDRARQLDAARPHRPGPQGGRVPDAQAAGLRLLAAAVGLGGARPRAARAARRRGRVRHRAQPVHRVRVRRGVGGLHGRQLRPAPEGAREARAHRRVGRAARGGHRDHRWAATAAGPGRCTSIPSSCSSSAA